MPTSNTVPDRLRVLAGDVTLAQPLELWRALPLNDRVLVLRDMLAESPADRAAHVTLLEFGRSGVREVDTSTWSDERIARELMKRELEPRQEAWESRCLRRYYLRIRPEIQTMFLALLGVAGVADAEAVGQATTDSACERLLAEAFGPAQALLYLIAIVRFNGGRWQHVRHWLLRFSSPATDGVDADHGTAPLSPATASGAAEPTLADESVDSVDSEFSRDLAQRFAAISLRAELGPLESIVMLSVLDASQEMQGALTPDECSALVRDLVHVNGRRHQTRYVGGLHDSLWHVETFRPPVGANVVATLWYLSGRIVGAQRCNDDVSILTTFGELRGLPRVSQIAVPAIRLALPAVIDALCRAGRIANLVDWLRTFRLELYPSEVPRLLDRATEASTDGRLDDARLLLREVVANAGLLDPVKARTARRRLAHIDRLEGRFDEATRSLAMLIAEETNPVVQSQMLVDIALMRVGIKSLSDLRPDGTHRQLPTEALETILLDIGAAVSVDPEGAGHARFVLGVRSILQRDFTAAAEQLGRAERAFRATPDLYSREGLLDRLRVLRAVAVALSGCDVHDVANAVSELAHTPALAEVLPASLVSDVVLALAATPGVASVPAITALCEGHAEHVVELLADPTLHDRSNRLSLILAARALAPSASSREEVVNGVEAIRFLIASADRAPGEEDEFLTPADEVLTNVLELARQGVERDRVMQLLEDEQMTRLRDPEEIVFHRARLYESSGQHDLAAAELYDLMLSTLAKDQPWQRAAAREILERLETYPVAINAPVVEYRQRIEAIEAQLAPALPPAVDDVREVRVRVIGGNENQRRVEAAVREELQRNAPWIEVSFQYSGWTSNWNDELKELERVIDGLDGVVLHYFIRTMFGRAVRKRVSLWRQVEGTGRDGILRGIYACANEVIRLRRGRGE